MDLPSAASSHTILWRRLDLPGHESSRLERAGDGWTLAGACVFTHDGRLCRLYYEVRCDGEWRTTSARVAGFLGDQPIDVSLAVDGDGGWTKNGEPCPQVAGCIDADLNFSPSTNLLPIRRLQLDVGEGADVRAAWLRFPGFELEPLEQRYTRTGENTYRYDSGGGAFVRDLTVDDAGFVTLYPGFFEEESRA